MKKRIMCFAIVLLLLMSCFNCAFARRADEIFDSATISLKSTKRVKYDATTYGNQKNISITACWLEKKSGNKWIKQGNLETPASVSNSFSYVKEMDYSDKIGTGTYRIGATFDADGHSITRYSNSRTF